MSRKIVLVGWDFDQVGHLSYTTTRLAEKSSVDPTSKLKSYVEKWLLPPSYLAGWEQVNGPVGTSTKRAADMATDGLYNWGKTESGLILPPDQFKDAKARGDKVEPALSKDAVVRIKQNLLGGLTFADAKRIADELEFTEGFVDAIDSFRRGGLRQTLYSDAAGMVVDNLVKRFGLNSGGGVPPYVEIEGRRVLYPGYDFTPDSATLTGDVEKFDKAMAFFDYLKREGIDLDQVAVIDDSGANVATLLKPVKDAGGLAVGFNVSKAYRPDFEKAGLEIVEGKSLKPFKELVLSKT